MPAFPDDYTSIPEFGERLDGVDYIDRPGAYAVVENEAGQVAVIEVRGGWFLPGGGIDPGESEIEALRREIFEEMGYQVTGVTVIGAADDYIKALDGRYYRIQGKFYQVWLGAKVAEGIEPDHAVSWLAGEEAVKKLSRMGQVWAVRRVMEG